MTRKASLFGIRKNVQKIIHVEKCEKGVENQKMFDKTIIEF